MQTLPIRFSWAVLLAAALQMGCGAAHEPQAGQPDASYDPTVSATDTTKQKPEDVARLVGQVVPAAAVTDAIETKDARKEEVRIEVQESELRQRFINEFGDGTVVDKVMITPIRDNPRDKPVYYMVGMGQLNGQFRAMALLLYATAEQSLFLKPEADRYIAVGTNCAMCYFTFSRGKITGVECADQGTASAEHHCTLKREKGNRLYPQALRQEPMGGGKK